MLVLSLRNLLSYLVMNQLHGDHIANGPSLKTLMNLVRIQDIILISDNFDAKLMGGVSLGYFF